MEKWKADHPFQYYRIWFGVEKKTKSVNLFLNAGYDVHVYINGNYFGSSWYMGTDLTGGDIISRLSKGLNLIDDLVSTPIGFCFRKVDQKGNQKYQLVVGALWHKFFL